MTPGGRVDDEDCSDDGSIGSNGVSSMYDMLVVSDWRDVTEWAVVV